MTKITFLFLASITILTGCSKFPEKNISTTDDQSDDKLIRNVKLKSNTVQKNLIESGPIVGSVTGTSAVFLVKPTGGTNVRFQLSKDSSFGNPFYTEEIPLNKSNYGYTKVEIKDLRPDTKYFYRAVIDGNLSDRKHYFQTFTDDKKKTFHLPSVRVSREDPIRHPMFFL